ncbi:MAG TPA: hypothetical protein VFV57_05890 [Limnobacter sp.]|nr:hypothetical protein [Limnobacter sp.]
MSKSNTFETELLQLIFQNTGIANIGDATGLRGSTAAGLLYIALHTADPGEAGTATTSEISYTGYARQGLARNSANFPVSAGVMSLGVNVDFPEMTGGTGGTVTHWSVVKEVSGASVILYSGTVTPNQIIATGVIPRLKGTPSGTPSTVTED